MAATDDGLHVSLRDFIERIISEHDRINTLRLESTRQEIQALRASVAAYEKSSERAVEVSREAQQKIADKANEFRASLDDANKNNISRVEADARFSAASERHDELSKQFAALNLLMSNFLPIKDYEKGRDELRFEIAGLRESRSGSEGKGAGANAIVGYIAIALSIIAGVLAIAAKFAP